MTDWFLRISAVAVLYFSLSSSAHAYLDPVTGSLIIQGLVALIAGIVAGVKSVRIKIIALFKRALGRKDGN